MSADYKIKAETFVILFGLHQWLYLCDSPAATTNVNTVLDKTILYAKFIQESVYFINAA